jgi:hypothetical protein
MAEDDQTTGTEELKDWLVEDFPVDLRWRLKKVVGHRKTTIKKFVRQTIQEAVEKVEAEILGLPHEGRPRAVRPSSPPNAPPQKTSEIKSDKKAQAQKPKPDQK